MTIILIYFPLNNDFFLVFLANFFFFLSFLAAQIILYYQCSMLSGNRVKRKMNAAMTIYLTYNIFYVTSMVEDIFVQDGIEKFVSDLKKKKKMLDYNWKHKNMTTQSVLLRCFCYFYGLFTGSTCWLHLSKQQWIDIFSYDWLLLVIFKLGYQHNSNREKTCSIIEKKKEEKPIHL